MVSKGWPTGRRLFRLLVKVGRREETMGELTGELRDAGEYTGDETFVILVFVLAGVDRLRLLLLMLLHCSCVLHGRRHLGTSSKKSLEGNWSVMQKADLWVGLLVHYLC